MKSAKKRLQRYVIFNQLSDTNQPIYTTYLPFLVDHNNLDKVKAVYTVNGHTKISNDIENNWIKRFEVLRAD